VFTITGEQETQSPILPHHLWLHRIDGTLRGILKETVQRTKAAEIPKGVKGWWCEQDVAIAVVIDNATRINPARIMNFMVIVAGNRAIRKRSSKKPRVKATRLRSRRNPVSEGSNALAIWQKQTSFLCQLTQARMEKGQRRGHIELLAKPLADYLFIKSHSKSRHRPAVCGIDGATWEDVCAGHKATL
tara:strand:- start:2798 stop:3361 length:564 start_codon:yes stop_codon:yes gene_type:complete